MIQPKYNKKNCAKGHIRPLYVNFGGYIFFLFVWSRVWYSPVQPLFSCCSICPPWHMIWPILYCRSEQLLVWFLSECGTAQLSLSLFFLFSCATADIVIDVDGLDNVLPSWSSSTSTSMAMIFSTNQRPRKCDKTEWQNEWHFEI